MISLIKHFLYEEFDEFKSKFYIIMDQKIAEKKAQQMVEQITDIFKYEKRLNNKELNSDVLDVLKESRNQKSNINIVLEDSSEAILRPSESQHILEVFDKLNENNQINIINNLVSSKTKFHETVNFCSQIKERSN